MFDLLEALYSSTTTALNNVDKFNTELGVRQGGPESPLLFNLSIDFVKGPSKVKADDPTKYRGLKSDPHYTSCL